MSAKVWVRECAYECVSLWVSMYVHVWTCISVCLGVCMTCRRMTMCEGVSEHPHVNVWISLWVCVICKCFSMGVLGVIVYMSAKCAWICESTWVWKGMRMYCMALSVWICMWMSGGCICVGVWACGISSGRNFESMYIHSDYVNVCVWVCKSVCVCWCEYMLIWVCWCVQVSLSVSGCKCEPPVAAECMNVCQWAWIWIGVCT